jgi:hypothetical protein
MKNLIALIALVLAHAAMASNLTQLEKGDLHIYSAEAKVVSSKLLCPINGSGMRCLAYGMNVKIQVKLNGCVDRMVGHVAKFNIIDGQPVLQFRALGVMNEMSMRARCVRMPTTTVNVVVPFEGEFAFEQMEFTGMTQVTTL